MILRMTMLSKSQENISRSHQLRATSSLRHHTLSKNTTRNSESIQRKSMMRIPMINHILAIRILHRMTRRKKIRHRNTLNLRNHRMIPMRKKVRRRKKVVRMRRRKKPTKVLTRRNPNNPDITEKTLSRNLKNLIEKSYQNKVNRIDNTKICNID